MLYGITASRYIAPHIPVQYTKDITIGIPEILTNSRTRALGKNISFGTAQSHNVTRTQVESPRIFSRGVRSSAKLMQQGNLQASPNLRINWQHPLAAGLVYLEIFDQLRTASNDYPYMPAMIGNHGTLTIGAGTSTRAGLGGVGLSMSANTGGLVATSGNTVKVPQSKGSYFAYVTADHAANDGVRHYITSIGRETSTTEQMFTLLKFSDNNTYFGWVTNNVGYRAIVASSGLYVRGDTFMYGGTWTSSNVNCFIKGKLAGSLGSAPTPGDTTTATAVYRLGNSINANEGWGTLTGNNFIYYVAMWNRDLSSAECNYLNQNPYCFFNPRSSRP